MYALLYSNNILFIHILSIHLSVDGYLGYFHLLAIVNSVAINIDVQVFIWIAVFSSLGYLPRNGIIRSYSNPMLNLLRNCQTVFHSVCTILDPYQECIRVPLSLHLCQPLLFSFCCCYYNYPSGYEVVFYVSDPHFLND